MENGSPIALIPRLGKSFNMMLYSGFALPATAVPIEIVAPMVKATETQLLVGIADERTDKIIKYAKHAEENDIDGLLLINSFYQTPTEEAFQQ